MEQPTRLDIRIGTERIQLIYLRFCCTILYVLGSVPILLRIGSASFLSEIRVVFRLKDYGKYNSRERRSMSEKTTYEYRSKLNVFEDESSILVKGDTFRYGFDKKSGLMSCLEVLGDDFLSNTDSQFPDIYVSGARDPREAYYAAKYEHQAECDIISANPYEVHIRTHGLYHNASGETFPVRYRITYEIQSDGTIFVIVHNKVYDPCAIRWLCISRGILNPSLCKYF